MKVKINSRLSFPLFVALVVAGCSSSSELPDAREVRDYGSSKLDIKPEIRVFHRTDDTTDVYIRFKTDELTFTKSEDDGAHADVSITIDPTKEGGDSEFAPTSKEVYVPPIPISAKGKEVLAKTSMYLPGNNRYALLVELRDEGNGRSIAKQVKAVKVKGSNRQNFLAFEYDSPSPLFMDRIKSRQRYELVLADTSAKEVFVNYYNPTFSLPPPPFAYYEPGEVDFTPDERFSLSVENGNTAFTAGAEGFYHFRLDTTAREGFTLFISASEFPEVTKVRNMLEPFRYLVSGKEYKSIIDSPDLKAEIEKYWINWAGDRNRARNCIKAYYTRVEMANRYFSSHLEGWMSDRGLIYLIYGEPDKVLKNDVSETWIFGEENNPLSITFRFSKAYNPFTNNDFRLKREDYYKPSWYRSIEAWRNGQIY